MEINSLYDELLTKYLADELSADENQLAEKWIQSDLRNLQYFENLKSVWNLAKTKETLDYAIDGMDLNEKWNRFKENLTEQDAAIISINQKNDETANINEAIPIQRGILRRILAPIAIAASVLLIVGFAWKFFLPAKEPIRVAVTTGTRTDSLTTYLRHETNKTGKEKTIELKDGSVIVLADKSEVIFQEPFVATRNITLVGKANFKVAKDKSRPFTVFSGDISTTALGTEFSVTAFKNASHLKVRLFEGKVVVKSVAKDNKRLKKDVYLMPGQELIYGGPIVKIWNFGLNGQSASNQTTNDELTQDNPSISGNTNTSYFMFNNQSLSNVIDNLAALYDVRIIYNKKDLKNIYFTGKYNRADSLEPILKRIGALNNLVITRKDSAYIISK